MNAYHAILTLHESLCAALLWSVFSRLVQTSTDVRADVRLALIVLGALAILGILAPLAWPWLPDAYTLALQAAIVAVQIITGHHWRHGVPVPFYRPGRAPLRRRAGDVTFDRSPT